MAAGLAGLEAAVGVKSGDGAATGVLFAGVETVETSGAGGVAAGGAESESEAGEELRSAMAR